MAEFRLEAVSRSETGCVRPHNEDSLCSRADGLWAVADGMGGHEKGEWASQAIVAALAEVKLGEDFRQCWQAASQAIHDANTRIWDEARQRAIQMGSTIVALCVRGRRFAVMWVGDSRAYLLRGGVLEPLTTDHTRVQEMIENALIEPEAAASHPMRHVLSRAVGVEAEIEIEARAGEIEPGDRFLLCSDGLTGSLTEAEIATLADVPTECEAIDALIELTLERGAPDNVTIVLVSVTETTQLLFAPVEIPDPS